MTDESADHVTDVLVVAGVAGRLSWAEVDEVLNALAAYEALVPLLAWASETGFLAGVRFRPRKARDRRTEPAKERTAA